MKAFVFAAPGVAEWREVTPPTLKEPYGAILHPVAVSPCSSDVHTVFEGGVPKQAEHILGHECLARVEKIGSLVSDFKVGEIVAVPAITPNWRAVESQTGCERHAASPFSGHQLGRTSPGVFAEYFALPDADTTLAHIPEGVTVEQALMCVDAMTTGFTGAEYANIRPGDTVCVMGIGPVGLMAVAAAVHMGAAQVIAIGSRPIGVQLAYQYGATEVIDYHSGDIVKQVLEKTAGIGADSVIIAGGTDDSFPQAIDMVRYGTGTVSNVNYYGGSGALAFPKFSGGRGMAGKTVHTELARGGRARIERMLRLVEYGRVDPGRLVTHQLKGLLSIETALHMMKEKRPDTLKIMVHTEE